LGQRILIMIKIKDLLKEGYELSLKDLGDDDYKVIATVDGKPVGELQFIKSKFKPILKGTSVVVDPNYQRQGIGSAMYQFAEKELNMKFVKTDDVLTGSGKALWNDPNRKFGNL
jgi:GNAT superfamily N-acetyltransferase